MDLVIIGGGLSGLTAAFTAKKRGRSVLLLESSSRLGGVIRSEETQGFLLEYGPNTIQIKPELFQLIEDLNLTSQMQIADVRTPRYIFRRGQLHAVPMSPQTLITTPLLTPQAKFRLFKEPFVPPRTEKGDETLHAFIERRLGGEVATELMAPFVSGVWAGDTQQLSAHAFPQMVTWEREQGSILKGILRGRKNKTLPAKQSPKGLLSFPTGIETLTQVLVKALESNIKVKAAVLNVTKTQEGWKISGKDFDVISQNICFATPAPATATMIASFAPEAAFTLKQIPYASLAVLHVGFREDQIHRPKPGFGFLCNPSEHQEILGCLWNSQLFPHRAPKDMQLWTVFMGGTTQPHLLGLDDATLIHKAMNVLRPLMDISGDPVFSKITRLDRAIPQYTLGHKDRMRVLEETEQKHSGLRFISNIRGGISVGDVVREATG
ncbi:MAG: Protoporphyrinogen oxidase [Elusimicrobia bacterium]|nr:Protoporphyrinogen oxidase [Elusimicrobiota bacterium]